MRKIQEATVTIEMFITYRILVVSRGALAEICQLPPSDMAISLKAASDTRVDMLGPFGALSCKYAFGSAGTTRARHGFGGGTGEG